MNNAINPASTVEASLSEFLKWRVELTSSISKYVEWIETQRSVEVVEALRFADLQRLLKQGRITIAFVAEFSRGKTELINALFFSGHGDRFLPSGIGRTTMCPTEISYDPNEEPAIRLLPVESRHRHDSIQQWKESPIDWTKIRLDLNDPASVGRALRALSQSKLVSRIEAQYLGLAEIGDSLDDDPAPVEIPVWRYAMINYPHPILQAGVTILDTPGLNALGAEPELTLSILPQAQAVVLVLDADAGVTKSDLEIWERYIPGQVSTRIAVVNKIDTLEDSLKGQERIEKELDHLVQTVRLNLGISSSAVFPVSARQALLGRIQGDASVVAQSRMGKLEQCLAEQIAPRQKEILLRTVSGELSSKLDGSKALCARKLIELGKRFKLMQEMQKGEAHDLRVLWAEMAKERDDYQEVVRLFKEGRTTLLRARDQVSARLSADRISQICDDARAGIEKSWTTPGLIRGMTRLADLVDAEFDQVERASVQISSDVLRMYEAFGEKMGFVPPKNLSLDVSTSRLQLSALLEEGKKYCDNPATVMLLEKRFMIAKFWRVFVLRAQEVFANGRNQLERWFGAIFVPLEIQIRDHKDQLQRRVDSISKLRERSGTLNGEILRLTAEIRKVQSDLRLIEDLITNVKVDFSDEDELFRRVA